MSAIEELVSKFEDMCGESGTEMGNAAIDELIRLRDEVMEWKRRAEQATHIQAGDKQGFDWAVLGKLEDLQNDNDALRAQLRGDTVQGLTSIEYDFMRKNSELHGRLAAMQEAIDAAREALDPFVKAAHYYDGYGRSEYVDEFDEIKVMDLETAKSALAKLDALK